jgi:hypothetical protein
MNTDNAGKASGARDISLLYSVQTGSGENPASYTVDTRDVSPGVTRLGREADGSPLSNAEVKNGKAIPPLPMCLHGIMLN